jgi:hypothetical protein
MSRSRTKRIRRASARIRRKHLSAARRTHKAAVTATGTGTATETETATETAPETPEGSGED